MAAAELLHKRVRIFGLQKAAEHNGKLGTTMSYDAAAGRYAVAVEGGDSIRVKPANLELVPVPAESEAPPAPLGRPLTEEDKFELLECARYGEEDDLQTMQVLLDAGAPVDFSDDGGNTALHKAAANGHVEAVRKLLAAGASQLANSSGNRPLHWAVQQGHCNVVQELLRAADADVLVQNSFGRSVVTEAFEKADARTVEVVLQHPSAKGLEPEGEGGDDEMSGEATHEFCLDAAAPRELVRVRELAQLGADAHYSQVLGATAETDRTGLQLWAAALLLSHWLVEIKDRLVGRTVCELGAGCGLCGIVAARLCGARRVLLSDLAEPTMVNLRHNLALNNLPPERAYAAPLNWFDPASWPAPVDALVGSDLVYSADAAPHLAAVVGALVAPGGVFLHCSPQSDGGQVAHRQGGQQFIDAMLAAGWECQQSAVPPAYLRNVLQGADDEEFALLFGELQTRTYALYAFSRRGEGAAPPAPRDYVCVEARSALGQPYVAVSVRGAELVKAAGARPV